MALPNQKNLKTALAGKAAPQHWNPAADSGNGDWEVLYGRNNAGRVELYGPDGNPISTTDGALNVAISGSTEAVTATTVNNSASLAAGGSEDVTILAPASTIGELLSLGFNVNAPTGASSGTHSIGIYQGGIATGNLLYLSSGIAYNQPISISPSQMLSLFTGRKVSDATGIALRYTNNTDVATTQTRTTRYCFYTRKKVY